MVVAFELEPSQTDDEERQRPFSSSTTKSASDVEEFLSRASLSANELDETEYMFVQDLHRSFVREQQTSLTTEEQQQEDPNLLLSLAQKKKKDNTSNNSMGLRGSTNSLTSTTSTTSNSPSHPAILRYIPIAVFVVGCVAALIVLGVGFTTARRERNAKFFGSVNTLSHQIHVALEEFELVAQWVRASSDTTLDRETFRQTYEYVTSKVLQFGSIGIARVVKNETERALYENATRSFLQTSIDPSAPYRGFHNDSQWTTSSTTSSTTIPPNQDEYIPVHWLEPIVVDLQSTYDWLDLDLWSHDELRPAVELLRRTEQPVLTSCTPCFGNESVLLLHPGIAPSWAATQTQQQLPEWLNTLSLVEIRFDWLMFRVFQRARIGHKMGIFIFDSTESEEPTYLSGAYFELLSTEPATDEDTFTNSTIDPQVQVASLYNSIVERFQGSDSNIWKISSAIDKIKREAIAAYTQPDGSYTIEGAKFQPYLPPQTISQIQASHDLSEVVPQAIFGFRQWTIVVTASHDDYPVKTGFVTVAAFFIVVGCACLALWIAASQRRSRKMNELKARTATEKTDIVIRSARQAAKNERELNDFIAHEIRNPLSACMSACSFVHTAVSEQEPLRTKEQQQSVREDVLIMENSLQFMNDLLRNMLDIHRASSKQLALNLAPLDVLHDLLEPTASMLYSRSSMFAVKVDCPENLTIMADKLRLKQVILNLGRNATKFVERGFIRLSAAIVEGKVELYVEDSGPGIPESKRKQLFQKFQESLDTLQQGTGIGLAVCRTIMDLMGGSIRLDETYHSGQEGAPGSRFIVKLNTEPISNGRLSFIRNTMDSNSYKSLSFKSNGSGDDPRNSSLSASLPRGVARNSSLSSVTEEIKIAVRDAMAGDSDGEEKKTMEDELPDSLSVLFVDDDMVLRKLFVRSLTKTMPNWSIQQCSNGETALRLTDNHYFDLIFMDQYMASADRQLLGTETVRALRAKGVASHICGLSANDMKDVFLEAGADRFIIKPFPCKPDGLKEVLKDLLVGYEPPFTTLAV